MYFTVIKHDRHLRTQGKRVKCNLRQVFSTFLECYKMSSSVLSQCNKHLTPLHLLYDIEAMRRKAIKQAFSMFYTLIKYRFSTNEGPINLYDKYIAFKLWEYGLVLNEGWCLVVSGHLYTYKAFFIRCWLNEIELRWESFPHASRR